MNTIKALILEDEKGAANNLRLLLGEIAPEVTILEILPSIKETVSWLSTNPAPDLGFFDIQLQDGSSFEIFNQIRIDFPIIFTTAFNSYAIEAFKVNSIDYLLKPITKDALLFSLSKYSRIVNARIDGALINKMINQLQQEKSLSSFLIHHKDKLIPVGEKDFAYFYIQNGLVYGCTHANQRYWMEQTVEELSLQLNKYQFFRANRQCIVNRLAIKEMELYFNGRLLLRLSPALEEEVLISKIRVPAFKDWIKNGYIHQ